MAPGLGERRHVVDHIAKRGRLDEQDVGHLHGPLRSTRRAPDCHRARTRAFAAVTGHPGSGPIPLEKRCCLGKKGALPRRGLQAVAQREAYV
jgi:hypothetical protein